MERKIFCFWTNCEEKLPKNRLDCLQRLIEVSGCNVILVTTENLSHFLLPEHPLHPAYQYLSNVHKADYLRTYFMNFIGGGYSDVKATTGSWEKAFQDLSINPDKWINGYQELKGGVGKYPGVNADEYYLLIGNCAYICKPDTPLTNQWYKEMIDFLDTKLNSLKLHPASHPRDYFGFDGSEYPIGWNEMLGQFFHRACYHYKDRILQTVPICDLWSCNPYN